MSAPDHQPTPKLNSRLHPTGRPCVDTPGFARTSSFGLASDRVLPCVRPLIAWFPLRWPVWSFEERVQFTHQTCCSRWTPLGFPLQTFSDHLPLPIDDLLTFPDDVPCDCVSG